MFFSYFPTKLSDEDPRKDLTINGDNLWGIIDFYFILKKYVLQLVT
jgi:hypothetical protein